MNKKLKYGVIIGGSALIIGFTFLRGSGGGDKRADPNVLNARVMMNADAMKLRTAQAETAADIAINRDKVTGATHIAAMQTMQGVIASGNALSARLNENYSSIVNNRISSATARSLEATRASVAKHMADRESETQKYVAKQQRKAAKYGATSDTIGNALDFGGDVIKVASSFF